MTVYISKRLLQGLVTLAIAMTMVFALSRATGNPVDLLVPDDASPALRTRLEHQFGLEKPAFEQFVLFFKNTARGDLGTSLAQRTSVLGLFKQRFPNTFRLIVPALLISLLAGIPLGVIAATSRIRLVRWLLGVGSASGLAMPIFWVALVLMLLFAVELQLLPAGRMGGLTHYVLPVATLSIFLVSALIRLVRASILDALGSEYVRFERLEGLRDRTIIWKYALRNALPSTLSFASVYLSILITGNILVEKVYAWPGAGQLMYNAILTRDFPIIQGGIILAAGLIVMVGILADVVNAKLDPRVRQ